MQKPDRRLQVCGCLLLYSTRATRVGQTQISNSKAPPTVNVKSKISLTSSAFGTTASPQLTLAANVVGVSPCTFLVIFKSWKQMCTLQLLRTFAAISRLVFIFCYLSEMERRRPLDFTHDLEDTWVSSLISCQCNNDKYKNYTFSCENKGQRKSRNYLYLKLLLGLLWFEFLKNLFEALLQIENNWLRAENKFITCLAWKIGKIKLIANWWAWGRCLGLGGAEREASQACRYPWQPWERQPPGTVTLINHWKYLPNPHTYH